MQWKTKEMTVILREDNIVLLRVNEGCTEITVDDTEECIAKIYEAFAQNEHPKVIVCWMAQFYVKKDVLRKYTDSNFGEIATALVCTSYIPKFLASIAIKMRNRFLPSSVDTPIEIFGTEEEAVLWSLGVLKQRSTK